jgi:hypothetical protein
MIRNMRNSWLVGVVVVFVLSAGLIAVKRGEEGPTEAVAQASEDQASSDTSQFAINETIGTLQRPRAAIDALPGTARTEVDAAGPEGTVPAASVRALTQRSWSLYLTPAPEAVCLSIVDPHGGASASCSTGGDVEAGMAFPAVVQEGCRLDTKDGSTTCVSALIYGVVPDGVDRVMVKVGSGTPPSVDVQGNSYLVRVPMSQTPRAVSYESPNGPVVQPAPIPAQPQSPPGRLDEPVVNAR